MFLEKSFNERALCAWSLNKCKMFWETLLRPDDSLSVCDPLVIYPYSIDTLSTRKVKCEERKIFVEDTVWLTLNYQSKIRKKWMTEFQETTVRSWKWNGHFFFYKNLSWFIILNSSERVQDNFTLKVLSSEGSLCCAFSHKKIKDFTTLL